MAIKLVSFFTLTPLLIIFSVTLSLITPQAFAQSPNQTRTISGLRFNSPEAQKFYVDGRAIPFVEWDAGPNYAGLLPISDAPNESRKAFFWFWPAATPIGQKSLTFWTNGGPGCSSLESMLQETGPISWQFGQARPVINPHSWTNATSMLYVEHPIGVGYTEGKPHVKDQHDVFPEMKNKDFYLAGESYAGFYVPYLADYIYARQSQLALKLQSIFLVNPSLSHDVLHSQVPVVPMVKRYEHVFAFNSSFMRHIEGLHQECGYADYLAKHKTYPPPPGPWPLPMVSPGKESECAIFDAVWQAAKLWNPAFNIYHILDTPPALWDVLDAPQRWPGMTGNSIYFDREEVKRVLHVPTTTRWVECHREVFPEGDASLPSALTVLPSVIERSKRSIIAYGQTDFVLMAEGGRLILQNMTWGGQQGFQNPIETEFIVKEQGASGRYATERGLTFAELERCGHMVPQYAPRAAFQLLEYMLGQTQSPSAPWEGASVPISGSSAGPGPSQTPSSPVNPPAPQDGSPPANSPETEFSPQLPYPGYPNLSLTNPWGIPNP